MTEGKGKEIGMNSTVKIVYTVSPALSTFRSQPTELEVSLGKRKTLSCWNNGIPGMKVGGVRQITSPPGHAYGPKGLMPFIDGKTDVMFEIKVISCKKCK